MQRHIQASGAACAILGAASSSLAISSIDSSLGDFSSVLATHRTYQPSAVPSSPASPDSSAHEETSSERKHLSATDLLHFAISGGELLVIGVLGWLVLRRTFVNELNVGTLELVPYGQTSAVVPRATTLLSMHAKDLFGIDLIAAGLFAGEMFRASINQDIPFMFFPAKSGTERVMNVARLRISSLLFGYDLVKNAASGAVDRHRTRSSEACELSMRQSCGDRGFLLVFSFDEVHTRLCRANLIPLHDLVDVLVNTERWWTGAKNLPSSDHYSVKKKILRTIEIATLLIHERPDYFLRIAPEYHHTSPHHKVFQHARQQAALNMKLLALGYKEGCEFIDYRMANPEADTRLSESQLAKIYQRVYRSKDPGYIEAVKAAQTEIDRNGGTFESLGIKPPPIWAIEMLGPEHAAIPSRIKSKQGENGESQT